jgi:hypothetical protein
MLEGFETQPAVEPSAPQPQPEPTDPLPQEQPAPAPQPPLTQPPLTQPPQTPVTASSAVTAKVADDGVQPAGCATCGGFHNHVDGPAFHASFGCADGSCIPGRQPCYPPANPCNTVCGEFLHNLYQCLCCPDPCYQPRWEPAANASFFADYARPWTVTRLRYDNLTNLIRPDRNQFFLKQTGNLKRPFPINGVSFRSDPSVNLQQLSLYQEAAGEKGSMFIEIPYRQLDPLYSPTQAGFSDLNFGLKSLLFDCELLQIGFQFRTFTPTGNAGRGLGTGHFSLDPSLTASLKLTPDTYFQAQLGNWIPLGGTDRIAGGVLYWFSSLNQVVCRFTPDSPLIATLEMDGWSFENGGFTRPVVIPGFVPGKGKSAAIQTSGGGVSYFNIGPGLRMSICNRLDFGGAVTWSTTTAHWADPWFRFEVRFLF